jgi:chorismate synthase
MDSVGGQIECAIVGIKAGIGNPFFASVESVISSIMFSVPAVKGIEFGTGFGISELLGSKANDEFYIENEQVFTKTNNNGGINGGITNSMPIVFNLAIKPTPTIGKPQNTINIETKQNIQMQGKGRHDPCIVHRAVPVVEACAAIAILDLLGECK